MLRRRPERARERLVFLGHRLHGRVRRIDRVNRGSGLLRPQLGCGRLARIPERPRLGVGARERAVPLLEPNAAQVLAVDAKHCHFFCHSQYYLIFIAAAQGDIAAKPQIGYHKANARASRQ